MSNQTKERATEWVARQETRSCACGRDESIVIRPSHRKDGIPRFMRGHHVRVRIRPDSPLIDAWVEQERGRHLCECGCGEAIEIRRHHRRLGIPRYRHWHGVKGGANPNYKGVADWVAAHDRTQVCACGCGGMVPVQKRHHWKGRVLPRYIPGHHKRAKGPDSPKYVKERSKLRTRGGRYFYASLRTAALERDGHQCVKCGSQDRLAVDHVVPVWESGTADLSNAQTLCHGCHAEKNRTERGRRLVRQARERLELYCYRALFILKRAVKELEVSRARDR